MARKTEGTRRAEVANITLKAMLETALYDYGAAVVSNRVVPDFRDGLKPVQRAIIWSMYQLNLMPNRPFSKSARTVGDVIGKYHPHGDCLRGDTKIPLLDGRVVQIRDLAARSKTRWVLSYDAHSKKLVPAKAHAWKVGHTTTKMIRVVMTNGEYVECTANHPFYVKGLGWTRADDLEDGQELVGGTIRGYEKADSYLSLSLNSGSRKWTPIHKIVGDYCYGVTSSNEVFHHCDENTHNNKPSNLEKTTRSTHAGGHGDYVAGLSLGRRKMFTGKSATRKAIREKNSRLLRIHNENLWLIKAVKAIRLLRQSNKRISASRYESLRDRIYNLTKLSTLEKRGISFEELVKLSEDFKLETSARGLTPRGRRLKAKSKRRSSTVNSRFVCSVASTLKSLLKAYAVADITWLDYKQKALASAKGNTRVAYADTCAVRRALAVNTVEELARILPARAISVIDKIERVTLTEKEDFYDFTVDGLHNMIVLTSNGAVSGNFVVAHNTSVYDAMVRLTGVKNDDGVSWLRTNCCVPLVEGYGNFGDNIDGAAAMRYTESRLSIFSQSLLLDSDYLAVTEMMPNFDYTLELPVVLPAKLPMMLVMGSTSIAFGASAACPSFTAGSVARLVKKGLKKKLTYRDCFDLEFNFEYGGYCVSDREELKGFFKTGKGSLSWVPHIESDEKTKRLVIKSFCPNLTTTNAVNRLEDTLKTLDNVVRVSNATDRAGFQLEVTAARNATGDTFKKIEDAVEDAASTRVGYDIAVVERKPVADLQTAAGVSSAKSSEEKTRLNFWRTSVWEHVNDWVEWRIELELKVIDYLVSKCKERIARLDLLILACNNIKVILDSLSKEDSAAYIATKLKISLEEANVILDLKVRQLKALELKKLSSDRQGEIKKLQVLDKDRKNPADRIARDLDNIQLE